MNHNIKKPTGCHLPAQSKDDLPRRSIFSENKLNLADRQAMVVGRRFHLPTPTANLIAFLAFEGGRVDG